MAHKKAGSSSKNGRDSNSKRLGVKRYDGEDVRSGTIILRQHGTKWKPGRKVGLAKRSHPVKVLARGDLSKKLTVRVHAFSATAKEKIEAAGGTCETLEA